MRGVYSASSVMLACIDYQALIAKNLANANTPGYKAERLRFDDFETLLLGLTAADADPVGLGVAPLDAPVDLSQGPLKETERSLDLAITGAGFLTVQTPDGIRLTRDGGLGLSETRELVTASGYRVLGENGPVVLPEGDITIRDDGAIFVGEAQVARLALAVVDDESTVTKVGENLIEATSRPAGPGDYALHQGYLEGANVNLGDSVAKMMAVMRTFEAAQRVVVSQAETVDSAVLEVGKV